MTDLFTFADAQRAKAAAMAQVEENAPDAFLKLVDQAIDHTSRMQRAFTADDIWAWLAFHKVTTDGITRSSIGPRLRRAADEGLIRKTGRLVPTRMSQRHRDITEWEKSDV